MPAGRGKGDCDDVSMSEGRGRGRPRGEATDMVMPGSYAPKKLGDIHRQMIAMRVSGMRNKEIAELLGYTQSRVSIILSDPRAKELAAKLGGEVIREFQKDVGESIKSYTAEALESIVHLMRHAESESVRFGASRDIMDRGGFKPKETVTLAHVAIESEDARRILDAIQEAREPIEELVMVEDSAGVFAVEDELGV